VLARTHGSRPDEMRDRSFGTASCQCLTIRSFALDPHAAASLPNSAAALPPRE